MEIKNRNKHFQPDILHKTGVRPLCRYISHGDDIPAEMGIKHLFLTGAENL